MANDPFNLWKWLGGPLSLIALTTVLGWYNTSTELTPNHDNVSVACFVLGGLGALLLGLVVAFSPQEMRVWKRTCLGLCMAMVGFLSVFLSSSMIADIIEQERDFPKAKTQTFTSNLMVSRAYATHGKGQSWNIQTMPIWSNLLITESDYRFMEQHRRPGDPAGSPDEISSKGYFCAHVTMQQSGEALRVLHAGSSRLLSGSIVLCPTSDVSKPQ